MQANDVVGQGVSIGTSQSLSVQPDCPPAETPGEPPMPTIPGCCSGLLGLNGPANGWLPTAGGVEATPSSPGVPATGGEAGGVVVVAMRPSPSGLDGEVRWEGDREVVPGNAGSQEP